MNILVEGIAFLIFILPKLIKYILALKNYWKSQKELT